MRTHDGLHLSVTTYGPTDAPLTVFLAHCWTLNQHDWHHQVRDLQREFGLRIRIVTWDHRGHGDSDPVPRADATIENLRPRLVRPDRPGRAHRAAGAGAGHSIGGMTLLQLADIRPDVFDRVVGTTFLATSSGQLDTVTLGLPETGPLLRAQIPRMLALRSRTLSRRARRRAPMSSGCR
jgi:pimeloyl-ACP methyl ester carboxylesterase